MPGGTSRFSITPEGDLIINSVVVSDDGLYQCIATNAAGSDLGVVNLTIYGKNKLFVVYSYHLFTCT